MTKQYNPFESAKDFKPKLITTGKIVALWRYPHSAVVLTPGEYFGMEIHGHGCELWQDYSEPLVLQNETNAAS